MSWEEMLDHLIEEVGAEGVLNEIVFAMSWRERYQLWVEIADLIDLQFHHEDDERDMYNTLLADAGARGLLDHMLYHVLHSGMCRNGDEMVEIILRDIGADFDIYFPMDGE